MVQFKCNNDTNSIESISIDNNGVECKYPHNNFESFIEANYDVETNSISFVNKEQALQTLNNAIRLQKRTSILQGDSIPADLYKNNIISYNNITLVLCVQDIPGLYLSLINIQNYFGQQILLSFKETQAFHIKIDIIALISGEEKTEGDTTTISFSDHFSDIGIRCESIFSDDREVPSYNFNQLDDLRRMRSDYFTKGYKYIKDAVCTYTDPSSGITVTFTVNVTTSDGATVINSTAVFLGLGVGTIMLNIDDENSLEPQITHF